RPGREARRDRGAEPHRGPPALRAPLAEGEGPERDGDALSRGDARSRIHHARGGDPDRGDGTPPRRDRAPCRPRRRGRGRRDPRDRAARARRTEIRGGRGFRIRAGRGLRGDAGSRWGRAHDGGAPSPESGGRGGSAGGVAMNSRGRPAPLPLPRSGSAAGPIFTVSEITRGIRNVLEDAFGPVTVQGEVAGYKGTSSSGHTYFSLKDASAQIDVVLYADRATPAMLASLQNGISFQVFGEITVYEKSGRYQIRALRVEPIGYGALQARFDALKRKLELEGLFAAERKRPLPLYPTRIGIITSESGAVLHDMVRFLRARAPYVRIVFADTRVQGDGAARDIAAAIARMNAKSNVDVLIVGRGGGSLQDLWAFNEEAVVRAIVASAIPVVSAVGH